jgi:hypothetical protein
VFVERERGRYLPTFARLLGSFALSILLSVKQNDAAAAIASDDEAEPDQQAEWPSRDCPSRIRKAIERSTDVPGWEP